MLLVIVLSNRQFQKETLVMPETVTVHDDLEIIEVHSFGQVTKEDLLQSLEVVDQIYQTRGYSKDLRP